MREWLLLTGASSGLGRDLAIHFSNEFSIILNGRNEEKLQETKRRCSNEREHLIWNYDLEKVDSLEKELELFLEEHQVKIAYFVHCAGFMQRIPYKMISSEKLLKAFSVNVFSAILMIKILSKRKINSDMLKSVVLVSSNISNRGAKTFCVYGSSKAALDGAMRNLAVELAPKIRINSVLPGGMKTEMTKDIFNDEDVVQRMKKQYPMGMGKTSDIVPVVDFLLSEKASWITGQQFVVDGGCTINITG